MRHYFCYSSSLDTAAFDEWKASHGYDNFSLPHGERAKAMGVAYTFDFPSNYWGGRVVSLTPLEGFEATGNVEGMLYTISPEAWPILQHKEGVVTGASVETTIKVLANNRIVEATAFVTNPSRCGHHGPVSARFLEVLARAYAKHGLTAGFESVRQASIKTTNVVES